MYKVTKIIKREFLTRLKTKSFWVFTLLAPVGFVFPFIFLIFWQSSFTPNDKVYIIDEGELFANKRDQFLSEGLVFIQPGFSLEQAKDTLATNKAINGIVYCPSNDINEIQYIVHDRLTEPQKFSAIKNLINKTYLENQLSHQNLTLDKVAATIDPEIIVVRPEVQQKAIVAVSLAYILGMVTYLMLIVYTNSLLKGVIEEKKNRIVEVIGMVVKPVELMTGKIIGIGLVGFVQLIGIALLASGLFVVLKGLCINYLGLDPEAAGGGQSFFSLETMISNYKLLPVAKILIFVPLFFISGFLLNGSITAALGATTNDDGDNSISFLSNFVNIFAIYFAMMSVSMPYSTFAKVSMYIPFLAPVVTPALIPFDIPLLSIITSLLIILLTFFGITFFAGKIYKASMLTYGTKIGLKQMKRMLKF